MEQHVGVASAYAQNEWKNEHWGILAGLRGDKHSMLERMVVSPRLNVRYVPSEHLVLRAGYSSGFRAPQIYDEDLHVGAVNGELYRITNASGLRHERSHSLTASADLCFHLGDRKGDLLIEGFYTTINDAFVNELVFDDTVSGYLHYERRNAEGARVGGVNVELHLSLAENMQLQAGGTWQRSQYEGRGKEWDEGKYERRMERVPDLYGYLNAVYKPCERLQLIASGTFTGSMLLYHSEAEEDHEASKHAHGSHIHKVETPSFFDLTLKATYSIPLGHRSSMEVSGGVRNLFDSFQRDFDSGPERDASYIYGPTLPRTFFVALNLSI